ncbi:MAG TPA: iron-containing alcohol dehydrogenase [archaeon]|nr:iron-containing alcohol dehydrogenase [archaeon]
MYAELPRRVLVEKGAASKIADVVKGLGPKFVVVVDQITKEIAGDAINQKVGGKLFVINNSTMEEVKRLETETADCIISVGGGKVIDVGKLAAHNKKIPFISVPTALSHDGVVSTNASITTNGKFGSHKASTPYGLVVDLDIVKKAPYRLTAAGAADIISNYTALEDWKLSGEYMEYPGRLALLAADLVSNNADGIKRLEDRALENLSWAIIFSASSMTLAGCSSPASGAEHMFSHALDGLGSKCLHGEQVGLGAIIFAYLQGNDWSKIKDTLKKIGAPITAKEMGLSQDIIIEALLKAKDVRDRHTILSQKPLNKESALKICKTTGIL